MLVGWGLDELRSFGIVDPFNIIRGYILWPKCAKTVSLGFDVNVLVQRSSLQKCYAVTEPALFRRMPAEKVEGRHSWVQIFSVSVVDNPRI